MSYGGKLLAEVKANYPHLHQVVGFALNEARQEGKREGERSVQMRLTGSEGMSTDGLILWSRLSLEYGCFVSVGYSAYGWSCSITCPDTDVTRTVRQADPEQALRACVDAWARKMRAHHPHLAEEGVAIP